MGYILLIIAIVFLSACSGQQPQATIVVPTLASLPTETPIPTQTFTPSNTPSPTNTVSPTPTRTPQCSPGTWWQNADPIVVEFLDAAEIATQTSRMALSTLQLELRRLQRNFERLDYPECVDDIYFNIQYGMSYANDALGYFASQSDSLMEVYFELANEKFYNATLLLDEVGVSSYDVRLLFTWHIWGGPEVSAFSLTQDAIKYATQRASDWLTRTAPTHTPTLTHTPTHTHTPTLEGEIGGLITGNGASRLRAGAGFEFEVIAEIAPGTRVVLLGRDGAGQWLNVRLASGQEGWVIASGVEF